jgi:hypothetical protein
MNAHKQASRRFWLHAYWRANSNERGSYRIFKERKISIVLQNEQKFLWPTGYKRCTGRPDTKLILNSSSSFIVTVTEQQEVRVLSAGIYWHVTTVEPVALWFVTNEWRGVLLLCLSGRCSMRLHLLHFTLVCHVSGHVDAVPLHFFWLAYWL